MKVSRPLQGSQNVSRDIRNADIPRLIMGIYSMYEFSDLKEYKIIIKNS